MGMIVQESLPRNGIQLAKCLPHGDSDRYPCALRGDQASRRRALREFATMVVLISGQGTAPLLRPLSHDGEHVLDSYLSSSGNRLVTLGNDSTARLWDPVSGRQIAILRRGTEQVNEIGLSPDGATAFTRSRDGVRLWETKDGVLRAKLEPHLESTKAIDPPPGYSLKTEIPAYSIMLSNDRALTIGNLRANVGVQNPADRKSCELWDIKTGRLIAQLDLPNRLHVEFQFVGDGRWIEAHNTYMEAHDTSNRGETLHLFSAENGDAIAELRPGRLSQNHRFGAKLSPGGHTAASFYFTEPTESGSRPFYVNFWDTTSWQLSSVAGPYYEGLFSNSDIHFIADDMLVLYEPAAADVQAGLWILQPPTPCPIARFNGSPYVFRGEQVVLNSGQIFNTRTGVRLHPPKGRKYHPDLSQFAPDGRFLRNGIDTLTEKTIPAMGLAIKEPKKLMGSYIGEPANGWVAVDRQWEGLQFPIRRLQTPDRLNIPPHLLELWAQVATRGNVDDEGAFVKWDEPTWEKKRQELAESPAPYPDFPFPGRLAVDRSYWLRQELNATNVDRPRVAKQLLERANAAGDESEARCWAAVLVRLHVGSLASCEHLGRSSISQRTLQRCDRNPHALARGESDQQDWCATVGPGLPRDGPPRLGGVRQGTGILGAAYEPVRAASVEGKRGGKRVPERGRSTSRNAAVTVVVREKQDPRCNMK